MHIFKLLAVLLLSTSLAYADDKDLLKVLSVRPGEKLEQGIKLSASSKTFSYEIEKESDLVKSVSIEILPSMPPGKFLKNETKGFCLVQPKSHSKYGRFFFFDMETKRRYEINLDKNIIGILIQDIPGARANRKCTFGSFNPTADKK